MKEFIVEYDDIEIKDGKILMPCRVGDYSIKIGDYMGSAKVLEIQAYGLILQEVCGITCMITLDKMPYFIVQESCPDEIEYISALRFKRTI